MRPFLCSLLIALLAVAPLSGQSAAKALPGVGSWTQYRGDPLNTGVSHSPTPEFKGETWRYFTAGPLTSTPVVTKGKVIAATEMGLVHAVDIETGKKVWSRQLGEVVGPGNGIVVSSPLVLGDRVYFCSKKGALHCFDVASGKRHWIYQTPSGRPIYGSPKGDARGVIFSSLDEQVYCVDPKSGELRYKVGLNRETGSTAAILGDLAYLACKDKSLYEIDFPTGKIKRKLALPGSSHCTPTIGLGFAFLITGGRRSIAVDLMSGDLLWENKATSNDKISVGFDAGRAYYPLGQYMWAFNALTGEKLWECRALHKTCPPCLVGDLVVFTAQDGHLRAAKKSDGEIVHDMDLRQKFYAGPIIVDGKVILATMDNYLICVE